MSDGGWQTSDTNSSGTVARAQRWIDRVPGYRGYRAKEDRRDADRRLRDRIAQELDSSAKRVESVARTLANQRRLSEIGPIDELTRGIRHLIDRVRTASYGYGGLFSDRTIDEAALDQLALFDDSMLQEVSVLDQAIASLGQAAAQDDRGDTAAAARDIVKGLHDRFDSRSQVIESGTPVAKERIDAVLASDQPASAHPAFNLAYRDAIAILGDNFIVDARIDVVADSDSFRFFRVESSTPERWLLVPRAPGPEFALLNEADHVPNNEESDSDEVKWALAASGRGSGELADNVRASGRRPVSFTRFSSPTETERRALALDWDGERHGYVGHVVVPADVELFGPASGGS